MPQITDDPPAAIRAELDALAAALTQQIPARADDNVLIATWNIRSYSSLTRKWTATGNDRPKRDLRGLRAIIEILSRFDIIAVQELKGNLRALRDTMRFLGEDWAFLMTDVTLGDGGNSERLAFIYDRTRVTPSGLAAELVVPPERLNRIGENALRVQFVRTPYAVSFRRGGSTFILVTLHVLFGDDEDDRLPELTEIAHWMRAWASRTNRFHHDLLVLGDFNLDRADSPLFQAFTSRGLHVPDVLMDQPRTVFDDPGDSDDDNFYDQIAWFESGAARLQGLTLRTGGNFDFLPFLYRNTSLTRTSISHRVSDHYPLWVEFGL